MLNRQYLFVWLCFLHIILTSLADAQTSRSIVSENPRAQYLVIKRTFTKLFAEKAIPLESFPNDEGFDLEGCADNDSLHLGVHEGNDRSQSLAHLAYDVVRMRIALTTLGYPETIWRAPLTQFEDEHLTLRLRGQDSLARERTQNFKSSLAQDLERYRRQRAPQLRKVVYEGGCGAGEVNINIRLEPRNGRIIFIPVFFFELCKMQQFDPNNTAQCNRWREPAYGAPFEVAGDYFYRAFWPDNAQREGRLRFTRLQDGQTVTFRKQ